MIRLIRECTPGDALWNHTFSMSRSNQNVSKNPPPEGVALVAPRGGLVYLQRDLNNYAEIAGILLGAFPKHDTNDAFSLSHVFMRLLFFLSNTKRLRQNIRGRRMIKALLPAFRSLSRQASS